MFAGNDRNNREHILMTSFPDRNSLGVKARTSSQGRAAHTLFPQKLANLRIKHLVCATSWVGSGDQEGTDWRLDTLPGPLELTFLREETIGDN